MSTRRSSRLQNSHSHSLVLERRRVKFDSDETHLSLAPGSVDDQVPSEDGCGSAIGSEEDVASIMDELQFDTEKAASPTPANISETPPAMAISGDDNAPRAASSNRRSEPVEWVKTLLNKLRDHRWSVSKIVVYWLRLQGGGRGLRQTKKAYELTNVLLEQEDFFSSVTRHPKIQRWAAENYVPDVVTRELDQLWVNSKIFGKFDPDTSATAADVVERDVPQLSTRGRIAPIASIPQLARHRETANFFARSLGLFLKDLGLKRRGIQVLHGSGLIDSYHTLQSLSEG
jgi:hypothetical protein